MPNPQLLAEEQFEDDYTRKFEGLVARRGARIGHEDGGQAGRGELQHGAPGPGDDQVGRGERLGERLDVGVEVVVLGRAQLVQAAATLAMSMPYAVWLIC